jgi:hypothetical protein
MPDPDATIADADTALQERLSGIRELLKALPAQPESRMVMYAIASQLSVIHANLAGLPRVSSN